MIFLCVSAVIYFNCSEYSQKIMMRKISSFFAFFLAIVSLNAQDKTITYYQDAASNPPDLVITLMHINADIRFKPEENLVIAKTELTFRCNRNKTDSILFSAPDFNVGSVFLSGQGKRFQLDPSQWKSGSNNLVIYPPNDFLERTKEYALEMKYEARPKAGSIYFIGWRPEERGKRKEIWAHRPAGWLPYIDARITMDMSYTFDKAFKVFANGDRVEVKDNTDGTRTWRYRMTKDHPYFSTSVVIGDYDYKTTRSKGGVPLEYWYYSGQEDRVGPTYQYTPEMMDFFEKELGVSYPYRVYRQAPVIDYMYGAMETTTATVFGDFMQIDPHAYWQRNYINTNAHEMAHQWFGNYITQLVNKDVWLTESFGTYYAKLFEKSVFGEDCFQNSRNDELNQVLNASKTNNYSVGSSMGGVARIYQKGSLVLDMLRDVTGDKEFREAVKLYLERWGFNYSETGNFIRCIYDVTGKPFNWFFDEWIYRGGEPNYKVSYNVYDDTTGIRKTIIHVAQVQETNNLTGTFKMPIRFEVHYNDGTFDSATAWIENQTHDILISNPQKKSISFVLFDPGRKIVKKVTFDKSFGELSSQARDASNMIDRYDALFAMRNIPVGAKRKILYECYHREKFQLTKTEIIHQLAADRSDSALALFREGLTDLDANVRKTLLREIIPVPESLRYGFESLLQDSSYLNIELALQNLCLSFPEEVDKYLDLTKGMIGWRGMNIRMRWLQIAIHSGKAELIKELISYTGPEYEFETRMNALSMLKMLRYMDDTTIDNARSASKHWNNKLRDAGKEYLSYFGF
jgi:aminopeptidase N